MQYKSILITGADGFIGSHLVETLYRYTQTPSSSFFGAKIKALSLYNSFNYWGWLEEVSCLKDIEVISGDIRDPHFCKSICKIGRAHV